MAHHTEQLGPEPFHLLQGRHVLYGHDHGLQLAYPFRIDGSGVDQCRDGPAVGHLDDDLFGPDRLTGQDLRHRELFQGYLPPVCAPECQDFEELLRRSAWGLQDAHDPPGLPVEGDRRARPGVEYDDAHGGGVDQGLQIGPGLLLAPVTAGVGDDQRRLRREHDKGLLVLGRERTPRPLYLP